MTRIAVVPGSFDPVTLGHLDVILRASRLFDEVHVLVVHNPNKTPFLDAAIRVQLIQQSLTEAVTEEADSAGSVEPRVVPTYGMSGMFGGSGPSAAGVEPDATAGGSSPAPATVADVSRVRVLPFASGLLADYCREVGAVALVKGVRNSTDIGYEMPMAAINRNLAAVETVFLLSEPANAQISSSLVRQVADLGGSIAPYVPASVEAYLRSR